MVTPFFITGLPRSRTSWLSVLFSDDAVCAHDLLARSKSLQDYKAKLGAGDSDSGLIWIYEWASKEFPSSRWLLVRRNPEQSVASLLTAAHGNDWSDTAVKFSRTLPEWNQAYEKVSAKMVSNGAMVLQFEDLESFEPLNAASLFLRGKTLNIEKFEALNRLRIEPVQAKNSLVLSENIKREICELWPYFQLSQ